MRLAGFTSGLGRRRQRRRSTSELGKGAQGRRARPARQRRRAAQRGGAGRLGLPARRARRLDQGPRAARARLQRRRAARSRAKIPVVVLVDEGTASASEIVTGALQDRKRATVVGTRTFGKGVFQEIERLSNGGALDITVGEYFPPSGAQPRRRRRAQGRGHHARHQGHRRPEDGATTRRCDDGAEDRGRRVSAAPRSSRCSRSAAGSHATPFFERGTGVNVDKPQRRRRVGDLVAGRARARGGHGTDRAADRAPGRRARRARGADARTAGCGGASTRSSSARRAAAAPSEVERRRARDLRDLPTFTIDPPTARDFDDAISAEALDDGAMRVWVHIADVAAHVPPGSRGRPRGVPARELGLRARAWSSRCCPRRSPTGACSLVPGRGPAGGHRRAGVRRREGAPDRVPPLDRSAPTSGSTTRASTGSSPGRARRRRRGRRRWPRRARSRGALAQAREARGALAVESVEPEFALLARRPRRGARSRPSRPSRTG